MKFKGSGANLVPLSSQKFKASEIKGWKFFGQKKVVECVEIFVLN